MAGKATSRHGHRPCRYCGHSALKIRTSTPTAGGDQDAYLVCAHCLRQWKVEERLGELMGRCEWAWRWAGYGRQWLHLEFDGWPIDVARRYLCIRKLDDDWGRGTDPGQLDRHGRGWGRGDETGWFILTPNYLLLEEAGTASGDGKKPTPMDQLIDLLFNERLDLLRNNDLELIPVNRRRKRRNKSQDIDK